MNIRKDLAEETCRLRTKKRGGEGTPSILSPQETERQEIVRLIRNPELGGESRKRQARGEQSGKEGWGKFVPTVGLRSAPGGEGRLFLAWETWKTGGGGKWGQCSFNREVQGDLGGKEPSLKVTKILWIVLINAVPRGRGREKAHLKKNGL